MIEHQRIAQERLTLAAKERKQETFAHHAKRRAKSWQPYVMTLIFIAILFGSRALHPSDFDQRLIYIACVVIYYSWLSYWVRTDIGRW